MIGTNGTIRRVLRESRASRKRKGPVVNDMVENSSCPADWQAILKPCGFSPEGFPELVCSRVDGHRGLHSVVRPSDLLKAKVRS